MNETGLILLTIFVGFLLGLFFYGGLWWSTKKALHAKYPAIWFIISLLLRLTITITGFWVISDSKWERVLICLLGFIVARFVVVSLTHEPGMDQNL